MAPFSVISRCGSWAKTWMESPVFHTYLMRLGVALLCLITLAPTKNLMIDRLLMLAELLILLRMLKADRINQTAISRLLEERTLWYQRRAHLKTTGMPTNIEASASENKTTPEQSLGSREASEIVTVLEESEQEQNET